MASDIFDVLTKIGKQNTDNIRLAVDLILGKYIGYRKMNYPEKKFIYKYMKTYSYYFSVFEFKSENKLLKSATNFTAEIDTNKKIEFRESEKKLHGLKFHLRRNNVLFRNFLAHLEWAIAKEFERRYTSRD